MTRLSIDLGSTGIKVAHVTPGLETRAINTLDMPASTEGSRVTHSPEKVLNTIEQIPEMFSITSHWEAAIASQRSTFVLWDGNTGQRKTPLISWRDRRAENWVEQLSEVEFQSIKETTGLRPEAGYPLPKIRWLFQNDPELTTLADEGRLRYGSLDCWLAWLASDQQVWTMDATQASRTLLYDPVDGDWSDNLCQQFDIPKTMLPSINRGISDPIPADNLWENATIVGMIGDQPASTIGGQRPPYEKTRVTLGTGGFVASPTEPIQIPEGLTLSFTPTEHDHVHQAEGVVLSAGRAADWLMNVLGINQDEFGDHVSPPWPETLPLWCPALNGVGAPFWSNRPAALREFDEDTSAKELCQGLIVSVLMRINDILDELPDGNRSVTLDGGLSRLPHLPHLAATIWESTVNVTRSPHLTCRGALIYSHWSHEYLDTDPWESLNEEMIDGDEAIPASAWFDQWSNALDEWGLTPE